MYLYVSVFYNAQEGNVKLHHKMVVNQRKQSSMNQQLLLEMVQNAPQSSMGLQLQLKIMSMNMI